MYDKGKILPGLLIFVALATAPFWWNPVFGKGAAGAAPPKLAKPAGAKECVRDTAFMRTSHMQLLLEWRETAVRDGERSFSTATGPEAKSLTNTCLTKCHASKKEFCDQCHQYLAVRPFCWDCHLVPKETT
jgi:hypothetical protein